MRRFVVICLFVFAVAACKTTKEVVSRSIQPLSCDVFLNQPFGVSETIASFKKHFVNGVKLKRAVRRNIHDAQKVDTIFQFCSRKSNIFIYKTYFNREMMIGGKIADNKFPLVNGVVPGMKRELFFKSFNNLEDNRKDSVELYNKELMRKFTFTFDSKGVLKKIVFSSYFD